MIPDIIKSTIRKLRANMTQAEIILWKQLKGKQLWVKFLRQKAIYLYTENSWLDRYIIPDFYCIEKKLIIEIDWSIHNDYNVAQLDKSKEGILQEKWIDIIRIKNRDVFNNLSLTINLIKNKLI